MQRLSEILGALHFLRGVCNSGEGERRNRREQMVASFNRGYSGFEQTYHICTPAADIVIRRYMEEGAKIARDITAHYAN